MKISLDSKLNYMIIMKNVLYNIEFSKTVDTLKSSYFSILIDEKH
jgi:hypothetical protein